MSMQPCPHVQPQIDVDAHLLQLLHLFSSSPMTRWIKFRFMLLHLVHSLSSQFLISQFRGSPYKCWQSLSGKTFSKFSRGANCFHDRTKVESMLSREKEKPPRPPLIISQATLTEIPAKPYPSGYSVSKFQKFDGHRDNSKEHVVMVAEIIQANMWYVSLIQWVLLLMYWFMSQEISKSLIDCAYTLYINLKPRPNPWLGAFSVFVQH